MARTPNARAVATTAAGLGIALAADERFGEWYDADEWSGMGGLYAYLGDLADDIEREVIRRGLTWGEDVDHYATLDAAVDVILTDDEEGRGAMYHTPGDIARIAVAAGAAFLAGGDWHVLDDAALAAVNRSLRAETIRRRLSPLDPEG